MTRAPEARDGKQYHGRASSHAWHMQANSGPHKASYDARSAKAPAALPHAEADNSATAAAAADVHHARAGPDLISAAWPSGSTQSSKACVACLINAPPPLRLSAPRLRPDPSVVARGRGWQSRTPRNARRRVPRCSSNSAPGDHDGSRGAKFDDHRCSQLNAPRDVRIRDPWPGAAAAGGCLV